MEIVFGGLSAFAAAFLFSMMFDLEEGGFLVMLIIFVGLGSCGKAIYDMDTSNTEDGVKIAKEQVTPEGKVKKTPNEAEDVRRLNEAKARAEAARKAAPPTPQPTFSHNPNLGVEVRQSSKTECEVVGNINFLCTNRVKLGDNWYTVKVNCDRDPYSGELDCELK